MINNRFLTWFPVSCLALLYLFVAPQVFWADSEMWTTTSGFHLFGDYGHDHSLKPLFDFILYVVTRVGSLFELNIMDASRSFMAFIMLLNLYLFYFFGQKNKISRSSLIITIGLFVSLTLFWERSMRVRSDYIVLTLHLFALIALVSGFKKRVKLMAVVVLFLLAYFISPKSVLVSALIAFSYGHQIFKKKIGFTWLFFGLIFLLLAVFLIRDVPALNYFISSFTASEKGLSYFHPQRFEHLFRVITKNSWLLPFLIAGFIQSIENFKKQPLARLQFFLLMYLLLFPNKLPFFVLSLLIFLILPGVCFIEAKLNGKMKDKLWQGGLPPLLVLLTLFQAYKVVIGHNNIAQKSAQKYLCNMLSKYPTAKVFDPIGLCPHRVNSYFRFLGPYHDNSNELDMLKILKPDILLNVAKFQYLLPEAYYYLKNNYQYNKSGLFYKRDRLDLDHFYFNKEKLDFYVKATYGLALNELSIKYIFKKENDIRGSKKHNTKDFQSLEGIRALEIIKFNLLDYRWGKSLNELFRYDFEI